METTADFHLIALHLYKMGPNEILQGYVLEHEWSMMLSEAPDSVTVGHYVGNTIVRKI